MKVNLFEHGSPLRIVVTGATGNVGTSLLDQLIDEPAVESIVGIARRRPAVILPKVKWLARDVARDDLVDDFIGADVVIHLAWLIQPARDLKLLWRTNVDGSRRVFEAARAAQVPAIVYASSIGAYSPADKAEPVDETWPTEGIKTAYYSRQKAAVERILDQFETLTPDARVVRLRPSLIFKRESAVEQQRLFFGPLLPRFLLRKGRLPVLPATGRLQFQAVHADDAADAYRRAAIGNARGPFNIAAPDVLDMPRIARELFGTGTIDVPEQALRKAVDLSWRMRLQPTAAGWVDMALESPLMKTGRANVELDWQPRVSGLGALRELIDGIARHSSRSTPPLSARPNAVTA